jgi:hypothetical protein
MPGETDLDRLIAGMRPLLAPATYVFATIPSEQPLPVGLEPLLSFEEAEGRTLILTADEAAAHGIAAIFPCRRITLQVHSSLEAVGFMAAVATHLARHGIGANPVAGYHHDHLFVPADRADEALAALAGSRTSAG